MASFQYIDANKDGLKSILTSKEVKRLESAEKLISKGDDIIETTQSLEKEIETLKNADGRIKTGKINKRSKQIAQKKVQASLYYQDGYKKYIDVLDDRLKELEKSGNSEAKQIRDDSKNLEKKAKKQYNKAENLSSSEKMVELIDLAQENQKKAIELQSKCLISLIESDEDEAPLLAENQVTEEDTTIITPEEIEAPIEEELAVQSDSVAVTAIVEDQVIESLTAENTVTAPVATAAVVSTPLVISTDTIASETPVIAEELTVAETTEQLIIAEEAVPTVSNPDVFLTIQFMADKKKATDDQIARVYNGTKEVIEMNVNDWFKYSIGKYQNLEKAKADMQTENIKGFIVAYNKNERISVKEAVTILNGES